MQKLASANSLPKLSMFQGDKKKFQQFFVIFICLICLKVHSQESIEYEINGTISKNVIQDGDVYEFDAYEVTEKEIEYHKYVESDVPTDEYKIQQDKMETYKGYYDDYTQQVESNKQTKEAIEQIIEKAKMYLNSNGKRSEREKFLKDGQELANKNNIIVKTDKEEKKSLFENVTTTNTTSSYKTEREIHLYQKGERIKESEVEIYIDEIKEIKENIKEPKKNWGYDKYMELKKELDNIPKTKKGMVLSDEVSTKTSYMVGDRPIDIYSLDGTFRVVSEDYMLAEKDIENDIKKGELTLNEKDYFNGNMSKRYPLVKETSTGKMFYLMSENYLSEIFQKVKQKELLNRVKELGYEPYQIGEDFYINSKTCKIKLDNWTYKGLMEGESYISEIDRVHSKINSLAHQTTPHTKKLDNYLSIYNVKGSLTPTSTLNAWRTATNNAMKFDEQIIKLREKYEGNYSIIPLDEKPTNLLNNFNDNIWASKGVLGM